MTGDKTGDRDDPLDALRRALMERETQPDPAVPDEPFECTGEAEYEACLLPKAAIARFSLGATTAILQMNRELEFGRVQAVADEAIWGSFQNQSKRRYVIIPAWVWMRSALKLDDDFWDTGYLVTAFPSARPHSFDASRVITFFGIRFWPDGLPASSPATSEQSDTQSPSRPDERKPLPVAEAERISRLIVSLWEGSASETRAVQIAQAAFPEHKVSRDPFLEIFRAIRGDKKRGRQPLGEK